jgi:RNA recognition motif-containing protein
MDIFVGNLAETTTADDLHQLFAAYGVIARIYLLQDHDTGQPHGVGLVEMPDATEAQAAIDDLQGTRLGGRTLTIHPTRLGGVW